MKALITAFEPFRGDELNSSQMVLDRLPDRVGEMDVAKLTLPVTFADAPAMAIAEIDRLQPQLVVCLGQAGTRSCVNLERIAINMAHAKNADNAGTKPCHEPIISDGPDGIFCQMSIDALAEAVRVAGYPCTVSNTAGLFVCNALYYRLLYRYGSILPVLFVHLPYAEEQVIDKPVGTPSMALGSMVGAITALLSAT